MFVYRGRGGPRRPTPGNVQCQRCLQRDKYPGSDLHEAFTTTSKLTSPARHYTYECKSTPQERPYAARPSRTQQLRNPKLMPKLTNDSLDAAERRYVLSHCSQFQFLSRQDAGVSAQVADARLAERAWRTRNSPRGMLSALRRGRRRSGMRSLLRRPRPVARGPRP